MILYQRHIGTWWAVDRDGNDVRATQGGRFLDVVTRLGYLRDLGVNAIQLLPIQEFATQYSERYNGVDYFSPEGLYQVDDDDLARYLAPINAMLASFEKPPLTLDQLRPGINQLKCLIDLAHLHGIAVIFDLVYNHMPVVILATSASGSTSDDTAVYDHIGIGEPILEIAIEQLYHDLSDNPS